MVLSQGDDQTGLVSLQPMKLSEIPFFFVFDVESVGLHGEAFAVGICVLDPTGKEHAALLFGKRYESCKGTLENFKWICDNAPEMDFHTGELYESFWHCWTYWKKQGAVMAADVPWPVETGFLSRCVNAAHAEREFNGPYPIIDVASVLLAKGYDPLGEYFRLENEEPKHDPLADARQSARILTMVLRGDNPLPMTKLARRRTAKVYNYLDKRD